MTRRKLSAVIITKDEERNIERCLRALTFVDEIVVVDSGSTDRTLEICERYGCRIIRAGWMGFGRNKGLAVASASNDWVLSVDADEEVTPELAREIEATLSRDRVKCGYKIRWLSWYLGKWIRHSGWNRKYKTKLFDRTHGTFSDAPLHERVNLDGEVGKLRNVLKHYTYPDLDTAVAKAHAYAEMAADEMFREGRRSSILGAYLHATWAYVKTCILNLGFLDGWVGHVLATNTAYAVFLKYLKLWEKGRDAEEHDDIGR
jgi:glycosyltransferase involved in cell wall biosynthesis